MEILERIREALEAEGYRTSWDDPFMRAVHPEWEDRGKPSPGTQAALHVLDPPLPRLCPFDLATVRVSMNPTCPGLRVQLLFYYWRDLEPLVDAGPIEALFEMHGSEWRPRLERHFHEVAKRFSLQWDTEYDSHIEDCLWGDLPAPRPEDLLEFLRALRAADGEGAAESW